MAEIQTSYEQFLQENDAHATTSSRKLLKVLVQSKIPDIDFHKPMTVNEPERISIKETQDVAIQLTESMKANCDDDMKVLFGAAATLQKAINRAKRWEFTRKLEEATNDIVPEELYLFCRWLIQGTKTDPLHHKKRVDVKKCAISLSQTAISMCLTERQTSNKKSKTLRLSREMPQQLAVRLPELVNMLHDFGMAVEYNRIMRVEAQIEAIVIQ